MVNTLVTWMNILKLFWGGNTMYCMIFILNFGKFKLIVTERKSEISWGCEWQ